MFEGRKGWERKKSCGWGFVVFSLSRFFFFSFPLIKPPLGCPQPFPTATANTEYRYSPIHRAAHRPGRRRPASHRSIHLLVNGSRGGERKDRRAETDFCASLRGR